MSKDVTSLAFLYGIMSCFVKPLKGISFLHLYINFPYLVISFYKYFVMLLYSLAMLLYLTEKVFVCV